MGDSNHNNSAKAYIRNLHDDSERWFETKEPVIVDRELNKYTTNFGPSYGSINMIMNPSFELDDYLWAGGTRVDNQQKFGDCSYKVNASSWATYDTHIVVDANSDYDILNQKAALSRWKLLRTTYQIPVPLLN